MVFPVSAVRSCDSPALPLYNINDALEPRIHAASLIQQFVIYSDANTNDLYARLFFYAGSATAPITFTVSLDVEKPLGTLPGINHIKAGSSVSFAIQTAPTGVVSGCKFAYSPVGGSPTTSAPSSKFRILKYAPQVI